MLSDSVVPGSASGGVPSFSFSLTKDWYTSISTRFWRSVMATSDSTAVSTVVAGWSSGSRMPALT